VADAVTAAVAKPPADGAPVALGVGFVTDEAVATPAVDLTVRKNERLDEQTSFHRPAKLLAGLPAWVAVPPAERRLSYVW